MRTLRDDNVLQLADGRQLGYAEYGDPEGYPVFLFHGNPGDSPALFQGLECMVAWYGPIVMNTQDELKIAFDEHRNGTFIKHPK